MLNELHLFAGAGGGILAGQMLGHRTVCAVEWEPYAQAVLVARQNDGTFPPFPIWDDVQTFDGRPWRGIVDIVAGGFPCQDISVAGKGAGIDGKRSGMWKHMARIVGEVRPRFVFVENSPALITRGLGVVLSDLAGMGYDCKWGVLSAADAIWSSCNPCADHERDRFWLFATLANANSLRELQPQRGEQDKRGRTSNGCKTLADTDSAQRKGNERAQRVGTEHADISSPSWWSTEPELGRVANGVAHRSHRLKAIGNGQVPQCAAKAFSILKEMINAK